MIVQRTALGWTTQILTDPQTNTIWKRTWNSSSWSKWTALADDRYASQSLRGLMSSGDKKKLDNIEAEANAYTLPVASSGTLGGIKPDGTTVTVSDDGVLTAHAGSVAQQVVFPVGYVVQNTTGVDPSVDFGGTWRQLPSLGCFTFERIG